MDNNAILPDAFSLINRLREQRGDQNDKIWLESDNSLYFDQGNLTLNPKFGNNSFENLRKPIFLKGK